MSVSKERAQNSAASSLKRANKRLRGQSLTAPNAPLPLARQAASLTAFMTAETLDEPLVRWVPASTVFPDTELRATDDQVRKTATDLIETGSDDLDALPPLAAAFHLPSEWGGEIFGTSDGQTFAAYAAMDFAYVPVKVTHTHHFTDATLRLPFPIISTPIAQLSVITEAMGRKGFLRVLPSLARREAEADTLWRIHDCLRDFLLEGELVRDDAQKRFTATIKSDSLFPWLADSRMDIIGSAFRLAYPRQARHGTAPSRPEGSGVSRRATLPPSISSEG